jgi:uncharacterized protein (DUF362 family)
MAKVAFVKTQNRAMGVRHAVDLLDLGSFADKSLFVKPNFNSADPPPGSTHLDVLGSVVRFLQKEGAARIVVGDRSGMGDTREVMHGLGVFALGQELGFETVVLDELGADGWEQMQPEGCHWERGFAIARPALEADAIVQCCCLKTHRFGGHFTLSLKNSVGLAAKQVPGEGYDYMRELHTSPHQRAMIAEINQAYRPSLIVLDGVTAFTEGGPDKGPLAHSEVVLAGTDRIAIDAVGVALLRYYGTTTEVERDSVFEQEQIARAVELGLGVESADQIELATPDAESAEYADTIRQILIA